MLATVVLRKHLKKAKLIVKQHDAGLNALENVLNT